MKALLFLVLLVPSIALASGGELNHTQYGHEDDSDGSTTTGNEFCATGDMLVTHDLNVLNDLDVYGDAVVHDDQTVQGDQSVLGSCTIAGSTAIGGGLTVAGQTVVGSGVCRTGLNGGQACDDAGDCPAGVDPRPGHGYGESFCDPATNPVLLGKGDLQSYREIQAGGSVAGDGSAVFNASPAYSGTIQSGFGLYRAEACSNSASFGPLIEFIRSKGTCDAPSGPSNLTQLGRWDFYGYAGSGAYAVGSQITVESIESAWCSDASCTGEGTRQRFSVIPKGDTTLVDWLKSTDKAKANMPRGAVVCKTATPTPSVTATAATPTAPAATLIPTPTSTSTVGLKDTCPETQVESLNAIGGITLNGGVAVCQQNGVNCPPTFTATPTITATPTVTVTSTPTVTVTPTPTSTPTLQPTPTIAGTPLPVGQATGAAGSNSFAPMDHQHGLTVPLEAGGGSPTATPTATSTAATATPTAVTPTPTATWTPTVEVNGSGMLVQKDFYFAEGTSHTMRIQARNNSGVGNVKQAGQDMTVGAGDSGPGASGFAAGGTYCTESGGSNGGHSIYARICAAATNLNVTKVYVDGNMTSRVGVGTSAPTIASCGTTPSIAGTNNSFSFTVGTPNASSACVVTWGSAVTLTNAPNCPCNYDTATTVGILVVQPTTTGVTITNDALGTGIAAAFSTGAIVRCNCIGRE